MSGAARNPLPIMGLIALSTTAFLTILTETMPAALMPPMTEALGVSSAQVGMLVSIYALASAAAAIPIVAVTRRLPRRMLYIILVLSFAAANAVTAFSTSYWLTMASRVLAGLAAGVIWPVICGYAIRLVDPGQMGRAVAITLGGSTVAMVAGLPIGTALGEALGWRFSFGILSVLALILIAWVMIVVPPVEGDAKREQGSVMEVLRLPGLIPILGATLFTILAHYTLYTYMAPLTEALQLPGGVARGLLLFGGGALLGVLLAGRLVDVWQRRLALSALTCGGIMMVLLMTGPQWLIASVAVLLWGASFGAMPTVFQSAVGRVSGKSAELATAMLTTIYNLGIFAGGAIGGGLLSLGNVGALEIFSLLMLLVSFSIVGLNRRQAFPG
ncbi:MFS transporter [Salinicola socius]|uniref:Major facilitator superfamily (MFS) profile domain-containing protein n=1 Tax=Salinicola socius TaxID=404433 RepID=A0A1Q8SU33_9GAMM|nr:MFS transporter [Salinicola socius]OLO04916.1 hypothetical protein BTW07_06745 [Salinicola socius]